MCHEFTPWKINAWFTYKSPSSTKPPWLCSHVAGTVTVTGLLPRPETYSNPCRVDFAKYSATCHCTVGSPLIRVCWPRLVTVDPYVLTPKWNTDKQEGDMEQHGFGDCFWYEVVVQVGKNDERMPWRNETKPDSKLILLNVPHLVCHDISLPAQMIRTQHVFFSC